MYTQLQGVLAKKLNASSVQVQPVGGGSINQTFKLTTHSTSYFCKVNSATKFPHLFETEVKGLQLLGATGHLKTPAVHSCFIEYGQQILVLEWMEEGQRTDAFWKQFGAGLAALHHTKGAQFGLDHDNYMGSVAQSNARSGNWVEFFTGQRLIPMVKQCADQKLLDSSTQAQFELLYTRLFKLFEDEPPSLLHGDLWSGNFMCTTGGEPVLIDPAVYYGHRSMDLGMTTLFGGFHSLFYESYHYHYPLPTNYADQWKVCNLYPLLIHLLLFGRSYLPQIQSTLRQLV
jgi:fructosamine-3-kinase